MAQVGLNKLILEQLENSEVARNDYKLGYIEFLQENVCETTEEAFLIAKVLWKALSGATYQREVSHIQNKLELFQPREIVRAKRYKHRQCLHNRFWGQLFSAVFRWLKK